MRYLRWGLGVVLSSSISLAATIGTVVPVQGDALPVTLRINNVNSPSAGSVAVIAVD
jgi:hypothetical protein